MASVLILVVCFGFFPAAAALVAATHVWSYSLSCSSHPVPTLAPLSYTHIYMYTILGPSSVWVVYVSMV